jgi:hypothetical protein
MFDCVEFELTSQPMTTALQSISQHCITESIGDTHLTMMSNDDLNAICEALLDKDGFLGEDEDEFIDDDGAVDDDALEEHIAHQDAAYVRKRNLLFSLMKIVKDEEMDKTEVDAVAFREQFCRQHRGNKKGERRSVSGGIVTQSPGRCEGCVHI